MKNYPTRRAEEGGAEICIVPPQVLIDRMGQINSLIAKRAYDLYEKRGRTHGKDIDDWIQAEDEIVHWCRHDLKESKDEIILCAELPCSYDANQLQVSVEPRRLIVGGDKEVQVIYSRGKETQTEPRPQRIFRLHELPVEVDPSRATAILKNDTLTVTMPKANVNQLKTKTQTGRSGG